MSTLKKHLERPVATSDRRKASFNKWYKDNKKRFNELRQLKYAGDEELRQKYVERQREYRKKEKPSSLKEKEVFNSLDIFNACGKTVKWIREKEGLGIIPAPTMGGKQRRYTKKQFFLIKELAEVMDYLKGNKEALKLVVVKKAGELHILWNN